MSSKVLALIADRDHRLMYRVHRWRPPRWFQVWMLAATWCGDGWLWYSLAPVILLFGGAHRYRAVLAAGVAAGTGIVLFLQLKKRIGRMRPCSLAPHSWANLLPPDRFSFPSGHTITAFAVSTPLIHFYPSLAAALLFCALAVALSRIMLGMHFLSDVAAGALIGTVLGLGSVSLIG